MFNHTQENPNSKEQDARVAELQAEIETLQKELGEENSNEILDRHIKLLHEYNEAKDATQILLGKLALRKETTVRQLHEDYGLAADD